MVYGYLPQLLSLVGCGWCPTSPHGSECLMRRRCRCYCRWCLNKKCNMCSFRTKSWRNEPGNVSIWLYDKFQVRTRFCNPKEFQCLMKTKGVAYSTIVASIHLYWRSQTLYVRVFQRRAIVWKEQDFSIHYCFNQDEARLWSWSGSGLVLCNWWRRLRA